MRQEFKFEESTLKGLYIINPFCFTDERGGNVKDFSLSLFKDNGIDFFPMETLFITSKQCVLRGLHFQHTVWQSKLVRCIKGKVFAVAVDVRKDSKSCGQSLSLFLSEENNKEIYIPEGFAFGTLAMEDSLISCKCGAPFVGKYNSGIVWNDPDIKIQWPLEQLSEEPVIAEKDCGLQSLRTYLTEE